MGAVVIRARDNARKTLETGVTTVRDLGSWEYTDLAMRELIHRGGAMAGPRMFVAGYGLHVKRLSPQARRRAARPRPGRRGRRGPAGGPPAARRRGGLDQDVRLDRQRSGTSPASKPTPTTR